MMTTWRAHRAIHHRRMCRGKRYSYSAVCCHHPTRKAMVMVPAGETTMRRASDETGENDDGENDGVAPRACRD
jgi:hypothetical protein